MALTKKIHWLEFKKKHSETALQETILSAKATFLSDDSTKHWRKFDTYKTEEDEERSYRSRDGRRYGDLKLVYGNAHSTVHAIASGKGCDQLSQLMNVSSNDLENEWQTLFQRIINEGWTFQRIDFAFDDHDGILNLQTILEASNDYGKRRQGRFELFEIGMRFKGREKTREGYYYGSTTEKNGSFIRIYDKALESGSSGHCIRVELVCKGKEAETVARTFIQAGFAGILGYIKPRLVFKEYNDRYKTKPNRAPVADWWLQFVEGAVYCEVELSEWKPVDEIINQVENLARTYGAWLTAIMDDPRGPALMARIISAGRQKRTEDQDAIVKENWIMAKDDPRMIASLKDRVEYLKESSSLDFYLLLQSVLEEGPSIQQLTAKGYTIAKELGLDLDKETNDVILVAKQLDQIVQVHYGQAFGRIEVTGTANAYKTRIE